MEGLYWEGVSRHEESGENEAKKRLNKAFILIFSLKIFIVPSLNV